MSNNLAIKEWKVAIYARLSKDDGDKEESDSIVHQKELVRSYLKDKSQFTIIDEYEDDGYSEWITTALILSVWWRILQQKNQLSCGKRFFKAGQKLH